MAKNSGQGRRTGAVRSRTQSENPRTGMWTKRNSSSGKFMQNKTSGGSFKGVRKSK